MSSTIPARGGKAVRVARGAAIRIINTHGSQVVDTWAFNGDDVSEYMAMDATRVFNQRLTPCVGDRLVTNRRHPILILEEDTSPGRHDTLMAACDRWRYELLGIREYHDNRAIAFGLVMRLLGSCSGG
ncbi:MAG: urea carboxylase-associated family protein, partial [bacterium]|nr:urea carboxylase-associated family protein [bacterium]